MATVFVIGAGISGLACARALQERGVNVRVLEKSRSLAGRCASRLFDGAVIDTGAQYVTIRNPDFRAAVEAAAGGALHEIESPVFASDFEPVLSGGPRFYHAQGNNRLGRGLAADLDIRMEKPVSEVRRASRGWLVDGEACDAVVCSAPWPQTAGILGVPEGACVYEMCLTAAFSYDGDPTGLAAVAYGISSAGDAVWSACENAKAGRVPAGQTVVVVQASDDFSQCHFDAPPENWAPILRAEVERLWKLDASRFRTFFTHRWKFSRRIKPSEIPELPPGFIICGDSVSESRVEEVWLSGRAAAEAVMRVI